MKVILILPYSSLVTGRDFKVNLFADGFHVMTAKQIWKRTQKYPLECWRAERKLKKAIIGEKDGITYRAFPSFRPTLGFLDKHVYKGVMSTVPSVRYALWREYSFSMLRELKRQCQDEQVLLHFCGLGELGLLAALYLKDVPIVNWQGGGPPYTYSLLSFLYHLPLSFIERKALRRVDKILLGNKRDYNVFYYRFEPNVVTYVPVGVDFEEFKPLGKEKARRALGIPLNKKVILHVGKFDRTKGFDLILKVYQELKGSYDVEFLAIGGLKTDPLYDEAIKAGAIVREWVPQPELIPYYSAADVYLFPRFYSAREQEGLEEFMGTGVSPLESLACGTPIVGTNLKHFVCTEDELRQMGRIPKDPEDVVRCASEVFEHPERYKNCREVARKYYSWDPVVQRLVDVYDELFKKYYG